ncbi:hypothetical protein [Nocardia sp. NBC_00416]|uniref:hypothetical protein n=1 Tax=Nocardia sp. NBC_00416 TaxID=2975991 RepID=UPI002E2153F8
MPTRSTTVAAPAVELVPDRLYRLGGVVPIDGRLSWRRPEVTGFEPISAYLLLAENNALLVGTGVKLHRELIIDQVRELLGDRALHLYADRNEADEIGNLAALVSEFDVEHIWFAGAGHLLKWFEHDDFGGSAPGADRVTVHFLMPADNPGRSLIRELNRPSEVAFDPGHQLTLMNTRLTVLGFAWLYDRGTRTLFCSDFFSEGKLDTPDRSPVMSADERLTLDEVRDHIHTRFEWMADADTGPLIEDLHKFFDGVEIDRLAPYHGTVIEGADQVRRHLRMALDVLAAPAAAPTSTQETTDHA